MLALLCQPLSQPCYGLRDGPVFFTNHFYQSSVSTIKSDDVCWMFAIKLNVDFNGSERW